MRIECRHRLQLKEVCAMQQIDPLFYLRIIYDAGPDVSVKFFIGETEIFFVRFSGKAVNGRLFNKLLR